MWQQAIFPFIISKTHRVDVKNEKVGTKLRIKLVLIKNFLCQRLKRLLINKNHLHEIKSMSR